MKLLEILLLRLPPWANRWIGRVLSVGAGLLAGIVLHYVLYRIDLPSTPFIYVAF
jgi:hypothetical protein